MIDGVYSPKPHDRSDGVDDGMGKDTEHEVTALDDDALAGRYVPPATPWLRVNFVTSVDGAAAVGGRSGDLSGPADRRVFAILRMRCDALLVGAGTLRDERYRSLRMNERQRRWRSRHHLPDHPVMAVVSRSLDIDPTAPVFADAPRRPIVITPTSSATSSPATRRTALATTTDVLTVGEETVELASALALLHKRGLRHILCEGGPHLFGELTAADLVDEVCLTVSPLLAGPGAGRITAGPASPLRRMSLHQVLTGDGMLFLRYHRER
jgi:riboflavin biosynthesis pyrimidine reductase